MKEPTRLLSGSGPARELMAGSVLSVPSGARQRALQFTGVAVGVTASGTAAAAAGTTSLVKSLIITVSLGAVGGGVASLTVSEVFSRLDSAKSVVSAPAPRASVAAVALPVAAPLPVSTPDAAALPDAALLPDAPGVPEPAGPEPEARVAAGKSKPGAALAAPPSASVGEFRDLPQRPSLFEEQRIIEAARAAVARGDSFGALSALDGYDRRYAQKQFGPEALALRVQALSASGQQAAARALAKDFEQKYPHHPLLSRVQGAVGR